jgi:hypothetical protein
MCAWKCTCKPLHQCGCPWYLFHQCAVIEFLYKENSLSAYFVTWLYCVYRDWCMCTSSVWRWNIWWWLRHWSATRWSRSRKFMCLSKIIDRVTEKVQFTLELDRMPCRRSYWLSCAGSFVVMSFPTCLDTVPCRRSYWLWDTGRFIIIGSLACSDELKRADTSSAEQCFERYAAEGDFMLNMWLVTKADLMVLTTKAKWQCMEWHYIVYQKKKGGHTGRIVWTVFWVVRDAVLIFWQGGKPLMLLHMFRHSRHFSMHVVLKFWTGRHYVFQHDCRT